jgi:tetratricopeptide (TPR) repeat protein
MSLSKSQDITNVVSTIQKYILGILVIVLPVSILPFPWDYSEKGMTLVLLAFTIFLFGLEIFKIIWTGKFFSLHREIDFIIFGLLIALVLTTIFAGDTNLSLYGYNYRLSSGLLGLTSVILLTFLIRSFIISSKDVITLINMFLVGSILASVVTIVLLFGGNIFELVPKIGNLGVTGLPITGSFVAMCVYNSVALFLAYVTLHMYDENSDIDSSWFSVVAILVNIFSLILCSVNITAFYTVMLLVGVWIFSLIAIFFKDKKTKPRSKIISLILPFVILIFSVLMRIEGVRNLIFGDSNIISPLNLSVDFSWQIVSQVLTNSLKNGIFGLGLDSFGVAFTAFKPVDLVNINLLTATNEVLTFLSNAGFLWLVLWLMLGWYIFRNLVKDIREYEDRKKMLALLDILQAFLYLTSFVTTYTVLIRFLFFLSISLSVIVRNLLDRESVNNVILKIWSIDAGPSKKEENSLTAIFMTVIVVVLMGLGLLKIGSTVISSLYLLRAESYIGSESEKLGDRDPTLEEQEKIVNSLYRWYEIALRYDQNNPLTNRKFSNVSVDKLSVLMEKYGEMEKVDESVLNDIVNLRSQAFEYSRQAINLSPSLYSNYDSRVDVYLAVINLGYTEYIRDAISVINEAISMNPYDYENYYNRAQLYYLLQEYDLALESSNYALTVKGNYIPALILSANVNGIKGKTEIQLSYLEAAKTILEDNDLEDSELYNDLVEQIERLESEISNENSNEDVPETEQ